MQLEQLILPHAGEPALRRYPLTVACRRCGAGPGVECATPRGEPAATHAERVREAMYAPIEPR